jgi:hypothetical protein
MSSANRVRGRIEIHGKGAGTPDESLVMNRAREIAVTNGRPADGFTQNDLDQAMEELVAAQNEPATEDTLVEPSMEYDPGADLAGHSHQAPTKRATDEQAYPEQLVAEGVDEAAHDRAVEGNKESARKDQHYEDQLPQA